MTGKLVGKKTHTDTTPLSLINVSIAAFYWQYKDQENNRLQILAANYPQNLLANPSRYSVFQSLSLLSSRPHLPVFSLNTELKGSRASHVQCVHNWHFTVISNSYQRRVLGWEEQWGPDKSVAPCSESRPDNRSIGQSIKPIISNLLMGGLNSSPRYSTMPTRHNAHHTV